jgi:hypothetical protein
VAVVLIDSQPYTTYADVETADEYLAAAIHATNWATASEDTKAKALVSATRLLNRQKWVGTKADADQELASPRTGVDGVEDDEIPQAVIDASIELALALVDGSDVQTVASQEQAVRSIRAGSVAIDYFRSTALYVGRFPQIVQELIGVYLSGSGALFGAPLAFGTDAENPFEVDEDNGLEAGRE